MGPSLSIWTFLWHILLTCVSTIDPLYLQLPHLLVCWFTNQNYPENFSKFQKAKFEYTMHQQLFTGHFSVIRYYKQHRDDLKYSTLRIYVGYMQDYTTPVYMRLAHPRILVYAGSQCSMDTEGHTSVLSFIIANFSENNFPHSLLQYM